MMKRSQLKKKAQKTGLDCDTQNFKKQRNKTTRMNREERQKHYNSLKPKDVETNKKFWDTFKPMFDSNATTRSTIVLVEEDKIINKSQI